MYLLNLPRLCVCSTWHNFIDPAQTKFSPTCSQTNWEPILQLAAQGSPAQSSVQDINHHQPSPMKSNWLLKPVGMAQVTSALQHWTNTMNGIHVHVHGKKYFFKNASQFIQNISVVYFGENIFQASLKEKQKLLLQPVSKQSLGTRREAVYSLFNVALVGPES